MVVGDFPIETDTIVIGAGPGGYVAAIRAAQLGQKVTIVEKGNLGGVCLNVGCIPSKALLHASHRFVEAQNSENLGVIAESVSLNYQKVQEFKTSVVNKLTGGVEGLLKGNKVEIVRGEAYFVDNNSLRVMDEKSAQTYNYKHAIIATGSRPIEIPNFEFGKRVIDSTGALNLQEVPNKLVVVGGGYIGSELGTAFANFGSEVTIEADYVLVTVGRRPNTDELGLEELGLKFADRGLLEVDKQSRTSIENIFAIGDIVPGLPLAHKASYEGKVAAEAIDGQAAEVDYIGMPAVCFTEPELAQVGYTEAQAKEEGLSIKASKFPYAANGRALSLDDTNGFVKLITLKEDDTLIGAQVVGTGASDIISELGLAIESGMNAEDIALTVHAHPTLGEMTMEAAEKAIGY
ncbi:MAG: dihydrolipoyl dehydrogenase, partial [Staphylococcus epidermidis]|nr:dihydrolipoyl dehydrogenase [Staphylococcus epidermidis]